MATKSFSTDYKITHKNADAIADAISNSRKVQYKDKHIVENLSNDKKVDSFMKKIFTK